MIGQLFRCSLYLGPKGFARDIARTRCLYSCATSSYSKGVKK
jgi:hypothetical protein